MDLKNKIHNVEVLGMGLGGGIGGKNTHQSLHLPEHVQLLSWHSQQN